MINIRNNNTNLTLICTSGNNMINQLRARKWPSRVDILLKDVSLRAPLGHEDPIVRMYNHNLLLHIKNIVIDNKLLLLRLAIVMEDHNPLEAIS